MHTSADMRLLALLLTLGTPSLIGCAGDARPPSAPDPEALISISDRLAEPIELVPVYDDATIEVRAGFTGELAPRALHLTAGSLSVRRDAYGRLELSELEVELDYVEVPELDVTLHGMHARIAAPVSGATQWLDSAREGFVEGQTDIELEWQARRGDGREVELLPILISGVRVSVTVRQTHAGFEGEVALSAPGEIFDYAGVAQIGDLEARVTTIEPGRATDTRSPSRPSAPTAPAIGSGG